MYKKVLTIQDISCYGQCSITVALPILSNYGIETVILPSAILSTHTGGFKNFVIHDLTDEMPKIINHWIEENIVFDAIYTGYIGDAKQFENILKCKDKLLKKDGLFIVDPAMADHGVLYKALDSSIINGMKKICSIADYILPNISEACFLTDMQYKSEYSMEYIQALLEKLYALGCKNIILTGVEQQNKIGAAFYNGHDKTTVFKDKVSKSYHGTGDIFSSVIVANILNGVDISTSIDDACTFVINSINETINDKSHNYGVHFEQTLKNRH